MLILGRKYKFTLFEKQRLRKSDIKTTIIRYTGKEATLVLDEIKKIIEKSNCKTIVLNTKLKVDDTIIKYLTNLQFEQNIDIIGIESFLEKYLQKCYIPDGHNELHYLENIKRFSTWQYIQKRIIDYFGLFWLFFFSWPVMLLCKKRIQEQSPGPIYFKQDRVGYKNKEFKCTKFRSMRLDAESNGAQFATQDDPRVFPWGKTMRKTRFDELPQMINILKGEMHLIGPRPERAFWIEQFEKEIPYYNERHLVRPGITGWAQVMYPYGENAEDAKQKLMYDLYYIKHWNILLELKVVYKTALVVMGKRGI